MTDTSDLRFPEDHTFLMPPCPKCGARLPFEIKAGMTIEDTMEVFERVAREHVSEVHPEDVEYLEKGFANARKEYEDGE